MHVCVCVARGQDIAHRLYTVARTRIQEPSSWSQGGWMDGEMEGWRNGGIEEGQGEQGNDLAH